MADPLKQICDKLGVSQEEALFYLEGFRWDLNAAMEACRSKTLPAPQPPSAEQERAMAAQERAAAEENSRNEMIVKFLEFSAGSSQEEARAYLSRYNWILDNACNAFFGERYDDSKKSSNPPPCSGEGPSAPWWQKGFSGGEGSGMMEDLLSRVPPLRTDVRIGSPPSSSTPPIKLSQESIDGFRGIATGASSQAAIDCLNHCKGNVNEAIIYYFGDYSEATAQVIKNFSGMTVDKDSSTQSRQHIPEAKPLVASSQVEKNGSPTESLPDEIKEEFIGSFIFSTEATREVAEIYLEQYEWDLILAVDSFHDHKRGLVENRTMGLPSQSQFESSYVPSGPTETQRSLEVAGEGDVTVATPGMAKAQVDGKAVEEEGSSMETVPSPVANQGRTTVETQTGPDTITITIELAEGMSGASLVLPFRSDQTIRDIRNAIDQRYPDRDRGYLLQSKIGDEYNNLNTTVYKVSTGGSTTLIQFFP